MDVHLGLTQGLICQTSRFWCRFGIQICRTFQRKCVSFLINWLQRLQKKQKKCSFAMFTMVLFVQIHTTLTWLPNLSRHSILCFQHLNVLTSFQQALSGVSSHWLRSNGPDVRTTWPAPGLRMPSSTHSVMQSRGMAICRCSSVRFITKYLAEKIALNEPLIIAFFCSFFVEPVLHLTHCFTHRKLVLCGIIPFMTWFPPNSASAFYQNPDQDNVSDRWMEGWVIYVIPTLNNVWMPL